MYLCLHSHGAPYIPSTYTWRDTEDLRGTMWGSSTNGKILIILQLLWFLMGFGLFALFIIMFSFFLTSVPVRGAGIGIHWLFFSWFSWNRFWADRLCNSVVFAFRLHIHNCCSRISFLWRWKLFVFPWLVH